MEKYKKQLEYSYTFGVFPTIELIKNKKSQLKNVLLSSKFIPSAETDVYFKQLKPEVLITNDKLINKLADKENVFVMGVFDKYPCDKQLLGNHVVLVNPSDMGNLGTIMRTMLGFNITNLVLIKPCADYFNPKVVRASMGSIFSLNVTTFNSFEEYVDAYPKITKYLFMLDGENTLGNFNHIGSDFALVFGNESCGLPDTIKPYGKSVVIKHSKNIDSLNLPMSVGISLYEFTKNNPFN